MTKIYYEKVGRRYRPVAEYNEQWLDSFTQGTHLVMVYPGGSSRRYNIDPNYAALIAASRTAEEAMCQALRNASEIQPKTRALTPEQLAAWNNLIEVMGDDARCLSRASSRDIAEAGVRALQTEADRLLTNPAVRLAYEQFLMIAELTKEHNE